MSTNFELAARPYVVDVILPAIPAEIENLNTATIRRLRSRLHVLKHCYRRGGFHFDIIPLIDCMLDISLALWELVHDNAEALADVRDVTKVRQLGLGANLIGHIEEVLSGEDTPRDILINSIATFLSWKSDSLWVKMAKADHSLVVESHLMRLQDAAWQFIDEFVTTDDINLSFATTLGDQLEEILSLVNASEVSVHLRLVFVTQIYVLLLHLYTRQLLLGLDVRELQFT